MMNIVFHPEAKEEFLASVEYYEQCSAGLGEDFAREVYVAIRSAEAYPGSWPILGHGIRRCLVHRFPYAILYDATSFDLFILAVMNLHRHPDYWKHRK